MRPAFPNNDIIDACCGNIESFGKVFAEVSLSTKFSDFQNLFFTELSISSIHSFESIAVLKLINHVFTSGSPLKVSEDRMGWNTIKVPTFHPFRTRANKSQQYQTMDTNAVSFVPLFQSYQGVSFYQAWFKNTLRVIIYNTFKANPWPLANSAPIGPNLSMIADIVPRKSRDRQPSFLSLISDCAKVMSIHGRNLLLGFGWGEPVLLLKQRPACFFIP